MRDTVEHRDCGSVTMVTVLSRAITVVLTGSVALMLCGAAWAAGEMRIDGCLQMRFADTGLTDDEYDFDVKRARLRLLGPVNDDGTSVVIQVCLGGLDDGGRTDVELVDAIVIHVLNAVDLTTVSLIVPAWFKPEGPMPSGPGRVCPDWCCDTRRSGARDEEMGEPWTT